MMLKLESRPLAKMLANSLPMKQKSMAKPLAEILMKAFLMMSNSLVKAPRRNVGESTVVPIIKVDGKASHR